MVYAPESSDLYGDSVKHDFFNFDGLELIMEGSIRRNHFNGVATVVKKLIIKFNPSVFSYDILYHLTYHF